MTETTVFKSNRSQAVRLPKAVALPDTVKRVTVIALGRSRLITPADSSWDDWFSAREKGAAMIERDQPADQQREAL